VISTKFGVEKEVGLSRQIYFTVVRGYWKLWEKYPYHARENAPWLFVYRKRPN